MRAHGGTIGTMHGGALREGFERMATVHGPQALNLALSILRDPAEAQDVLQESYGEAWEKWGTLRDPARAGGWLREIVRNNAFDTLRRRRRRATSPLPAEEPQAPPEGADRMTRWIVAEAVEQLPEEFRVVVALRYLEGLAYEEIAARLGAPLGTVRSRLFRAQARLREILGDAV